MIKGATPLPKVNFILPILEPYQHHSLIAVRTLYKKNKDVIIAKNEVPWLSELYINC